MSDSKDKELGMDRSIPRREFMSGVATGLVGLAVSRAFGGSSPDSSGMEPQTDLTGGDRSYPPSLTGLRGQYPGSFDSAHQSARRRLWR